VTSRRSAIGSDLGLVDLGSLAAGTLKEEPQLPQKRAPLRFSSPQVAQRTAKLAPQLSQKLRPAGFSVPQFKQTKHVPFRRQA